MLIVAVLGLLMAVMLPLCLEEVRLEVLRLAAVGGWFLGGGDDSSDDYNSVDNVDSISVDTKYISKSETDIIKEIHKAVGDIHIEWSDPLVQKQLLSGVVVLVLVLCFVKHWLARESQKELSALSEELIKEQEEFSTVFDVSLPECQLMDVCTINDKALLEKSRIMEYYTTISSNNTSNNTSNDTDSFERHESLLDEDDAKKLSSNFSTHFDSLSVKSSSTGIGSSTSPARNSFHSPSKLIFQSSSFSILKHQPEHTANDSGTVGDVTQETVYSTSFGSSDNASLRSLKNSDY